MSVNVSSPAVILAVMLIVSPTVAVIGSIVTVRGITVIVFVMVVVLYFPFGSEYVTIIVMLSVVFGVYLIELSSIVIIFPFIVAIRLPVILFPNESVALIVIVISLYCTVGSESVLISILDLNPVVVGRLFLIVAVPVLLIALSPKVSYDSI